MNYHSENNNTSYNDQEIQQRIYLTMKCLEEIDLVKSQSMETRAKINERLVKSSFDDVRFQLNLFESQLINKLNKQLFQRQVDLALTSLEYEMRQLILNLSTSMHSVNEASKPIVLNDADAQIKTLVSKLTEIERYLKVQEDQFSRKPTNGMSSFLDMLKNLIADESSNIVRNYSTSNEEKNNYRKDLNNNNNDEKVSIKKKEECEWHMANGHLNEDNSIETITTGDQNDDSIASVETLTNDHVENDRNSFDFVDFGSELDSIEVITEFDETQTKKLENDQDETRSTLVVEQSLNKLHLTSDDQTSHDDESTMTMTVTTTTNTCDGFSKTFDEILSKPMSYWLLQPTSTAN